MPAGVYQPWNRFGSGVGAAPGAGGAVPRETSGQPPGTFVRIGGRPAAANPNAYTPWDPSQAPAFPPSGSFNPSREIEGQEATRGLQQAEGQIGTSRSRDTADYFTQLSEIGRGEGQRTQDLQRNLGLLKQSYERLGTAQQEQANKAGVLQGGALLQAAAKRSANEGQERGKMQTAFDRAQEADQLQRAKLAREGAPPDASNPLGGRAFQDLTTQLANLQSNNAFFQQAQQSLAAQEAAERGFGGYQAPAGQKVDRHGNPYREVRKGVYVTPSGARAYPVL